MRARPWPVTRKRFLLLALSFWKLARPSKEIFTIHSHIPSSLCWKRHLHLLWTQKVNPCRYWECSTSSDDKNVLPVLAYLRTVTSNEASQPCNPRSPKTRPASSHVCKSLFIPYFSLLSFCSFFPQAVDSTISTVHSSTSLHYYLGGKKELGVRRTKFENWQLCEIT